MKQRQAGFTLVEVLIALFIFTLISLMLVQGLHSVIQTQSRTEERATRLRKLQFALLILSRDVEQTVARSVYDSLGALEEPFMGSEHGFTFTHMGYVNLSASGRSTLKRTGYHLNEDKLVKTSWNDLDQLPHSESHTRTLLTDLTHATFSYLDHDNHFNTKWPGGEQSNTGIPKAIKISLTIADWGEIHQLYVIPAGVKPK